MSTAIQGLITLEKSGAPRLPMFLVGAAEAGQMKKVNFDWKLLERFGDVVTNYPAKKVALFANPDGFITLVANVDSDQIITEIDVDEARRMVELLNKAIAVAEPTFREMVAEFMAMDAISKASQ